MSADMHDLPSTAVHNLREADILLTEGVQRIMHASTDLPGVSHPLQEALALSEQQAMITLEAVESAQHEVSAIRAANGEFIDDRLDRLEEHLQAILTTQQGQDLAGQRLKKTITLLQAVEQRIQEALDQLGHARGTTQPPEDDTFSGERMDQNNVDDLLAQLGI